MRSLVTLVLLASFLSSCLSESTPTCSLTDEERKDPNLQEITFDLGYGAEFFEAYMDPDIKTMSRGKHDTIINPKFNGHAAKFFNMSPQTVRYYWVNDKNEPNFMGTIKPFHSLGTASFPGHRFLLGPQDYEQSKVVLQHFTIDKDMGGPSNLYYYDPITIPGDEARTKQNLSILTLPEYEKYNKMVRNRKFAEEYKTITGRDYMTMYPRPKPVHFMWPADHFEQVHWVTTRETHFKTLPDDSLLSPVRERYLDRVLEDDKPRLLAEYREPGEYLNMTLKVASVRPRVYEIDDFLSEVEVDHIVHYARNANLKESTVGQGGDSAKVKVRTSLNTWVGRETNQIFDTVYRRAADLLKIDEALFRVRDGTEFPDWPNKESIGEQLQLVHYNKHQEYTAHHDFGYSNVDDKLQPARFATLLLYLNDPDEGGETEFPRWQNGFTGETLLVKPKKGKAALFYSFLPDGNLDDFSQHAAKPVLKGEKYLINLWVRDPIKDF